ncbi:hypothetical protein H6G98_00885 [Nostoc sp. FACHB-857]|nr:hypothetical protein [Nostoc sp. FACHB-857]
MWGVWEERGVWEVWGVWGVWEERGVWEVWGVWGVWGERFLPHPPTPPHAQCPMPNAPCPMPSSSLLPVACCELRLWDGAINQR